MTKFVLSDVNLKNICRDFYMMGKNDASYVFFEERFSEVKKQSKKEKKRVR
jgi:hypothetical protein